MTRIKATLIHIFLSITIIGAFVLIVLYLWYPKPLFSIARVIEPLKLLILIDVIIGPLLTFIVFSRTKAKKLLKIDLSIIAIIQLMALAYGAYTIYNGRASIIAFADGKFHYLVEKYAKNNELNFEELKPEFFTKPKMAYIPNLKGFDVYASYADIEPLKNYKIILPFALSVENMQAKFKSKKQAIDVLVAIYVDDEIVFLKLDKDMAVSYIVYSKTKNQIIDQLEF